MPSLQGASTRKILQHQPSQRRGSLSNKGEAPHLTSIEKEAFIEPINKPLRVTSYSQGGRMVQSLSADADGSSPNKGISSSSSSSSTAAVARRYADNHRPSYLNEEAVEEAMTQRQNLAQEILMEGCVQSYVDFFYRTHRPDPRAEELVEAGIAAAGEIDILVPTNELHFIKENLMEAELARRRVEMEIAFGAYEKLASYYQELEDAKTSVYFYEKCLEIARVTGNKAQEMLCNSCLGTVYDLAKDLVSAIGYHEKHRELALGQNHSEETHKANAALMKVYMRYADEREKQGDFNEAIVYFEKCLEAAKRAENVAAEGRACYRLAKAHMNSQSNYDVAIKYLTHYEGISSTLKDLEGSAKAFEALAKAYQRVGDHEKGVVFLEEFLKMAASTNNLKGQADACSDLGLILSRRRQYKMAVVNFKRKYEITRDLLQGGQGTMKELTEAQIYLGIARGNALLGGYIKTVNEGVGSLLEWKTRHDEAALLSSSSSQQQRK